jgi:hypothetical protein
MAYFLLAFPTIHVNRHQYDRHNPVFPEMCQDCNPGQENQKYLSAVGKCSPHPCNEYSCKRQNDYPPADTAHVFRHSRQDYTVQLDGACHNAALLLDTYSIW